MVVSIGVGQMAGSDPFSIVSESNFGAGSRRKIYPIISYVAILALSIGSGITTYYGMTEYAFESVSLMVTIGVQSLMFVFALWLGYLPSIRDGRALLGHVDKLLIQTRTAAI